MPPKTPSELREQIEAQQNELAAPGHERTAEGMEVETPTQSELVENVRKVSKSLPKRRNT